MLMIVIVIVIVVVIVIVLVPVLHCWLPRVRVWVAGEWGLSGDEAGESAGG